MGEGRGGGVSRFQGYTMHGRHKALIHHIQFPEVARFRQLELKVIQNSRCIDNRDLKIGRRDELGRLQEVNLHNRAYARELLPRVFAVVVSSRTPFREFCRRVENVSIFIFF